MKLNDRMRYPHPVLSEYSSDYVSGEFRCEFQQNLTKDNEIRIAADLDVTCDVLKGLISDQKAAIGYYVICRRTYHNALQESGLGKSESFVNASRLYGTVVIRPVIWTLEAIGDFSSPLFDDEFGESVQVGKGSIIALGPEFRFSVDRKKYKPFDSIFELAENANAKAGTIEVDASQDRITISAERETYRALAGMRNVPDGRKILLNAVYMPAIMDVISRLQTGERSLEGQKWYRVFKAKCDDMAITPSDPGLSPLEAAQALLRQPLGKTIAAVERLS